jgi:hypothetical protein
MVWYDNEWGYSNRLVELVADTCKFLLKDNNPQSAPKEEQKEEFTPHNPGDTFEPAPNSVEKHQEQMLEAPDSSKEELLPAPESLEHNPEHHEGIRQF